MRRLLRKNELVSSHFVPTCTKKQMLPFLSPITTTACSLPLHLRETNWSLYAIRATSIIPRSSGLTLVMGTGNSKRRHVSCGTRTVWELSPSLPPFIPQERADLGLMNNMFSPTVWIVPSLFQRFREYTRVFRCLSEPPVFYQPSLQHDPLLFGSLLLILQNSFAC